MFRIFAAAIKNTAVKMKRTITQNQAHVETGFHSVVSTPIYHSSMGGPSSLEISRQLMFHPQGLPAVF